MKNFLPLLFLFFALNVFSQKEANFWYFGFNAGLDFSNCNPVALENGKLSTFEGCSTISNSNGNLLFYSDGTTVWNKNHDVMPGGVGLRGDSSSAQSALFVPNPENSNIYYLFVVSNSRNPGFYYYTVDLSTNGGLGSVVDGPVDLNNGERDNWTERVTAIQSNKSNEFWIISASNNRIYSYKITKNGVDNTPVISNINGDNIENRGSLKVSPDGSKLVVTSQTADCLLFDFNTADGTASNKQILNINSGSYGAEFSQTGNRLYISTGTQNQTNPNPSDSYIYQYDLTQNTIADINSSRTTINTWYGFRGALQLGPDARIYYAKSGESSLGVINEPEELGSNVNYVHNGISLGSRTSSEGLPPFIQSFFKVALTDIDTGKKIAGELLVCIGETKKLGINNILDFDDTADTSRPITYNWYRDNVFLTGENNSIITVGTSPRNTDGIYTLKTTYFNNCGRERSLEAIASIKFAPKPTINTIDIYEQCDFDTNSTDYITSFNLTTKETEIYTGSESVNIEFFELSDTSFSNPVDKNNYRNTIPTSPTNGNHKLVVRVTNTSSLCSELGEIELKVNPSSSSVTYTDLYTCELNQNSSDPNSRNSLGSNNSYYDLDLKTTEIINNSGGSLSNSTHDFSYYKTLADAGLQNNRIEKPYESKLFNNADDVFVRISLKGSGACESIGNFKIYIQDLPVPKGNISPITLCVSNPIPNPQLNTVDLDASTGVSGDRYVWYRNGNPLNIPNTPILKATQEGTYRVEVFRTYTNDPSNTLDDFDCMGYNTFDVFESNLALIESVEFIDNQDLPDENTITIKVTGKGDYEYAINSNNITDFNKGPENLTYTFKNVLPGLNTVYIRDINDCGIVESQKLSFIYVQRHFTPNGDGSFDFWTVQGVNNSFYASVKLNIFDRYGRLIKIADLKTDNGWNGYSNGKMMPSNDYWYNLVLIDINGNIRKEVGHFSLLRR